MDKLAVVRSLHHTTGDHFAGAHWMLTGYHGSDRTPTSTRCTPRPARSPPRLRGPNRRGLPAYVAVPFAASDRPGPRLQRRRLPRHALQPVPDRRRPERRPNFSVQQPDAARRRHAGAAGGPPEAARPASTRSAATSTAAARLDSLDRFQREAYELISGPGGPAGVRHQQGRPPAARPLRPAHLGPELPAGPAAGRGGRHLRDRPHGRLGPPRPHRAGHEEQAADLGPGRRRPGRGPERPRPVRAGGDLRVRRVRPDAADQRERRPRPLGPVGLLRPGRRRAARAARWSARPTRKGEYPKDRPVGPEDMLATLYHVLGIDTQPDVHRPHRPAAPDPARRARRLPSWFSGHFPLICVGNPHPGDCIMCPAIAAAVSWGMVQAVSRMEAGPVGTGPRPDPHEPVAPPRFPGPRPVRRRSPQCPRRRSFKVPRPKHRSTPRPTGA